jgi:Tol biopolymer transport system component
MGAPGSAVELNGKVADETAHKVELQRRDAGEFVTLENTELTDSGAFTFTTSLPTDRARAVYRVVAGVSDPTTGEEAGYVSRIADATITTSITGRLTSEHSYYPAISGDGRYVTFSSNSSDSSEGPDIFVWDRAAGSTTRIRHDIGGVGYPTISADGRYVAYSSTRIADDTELDDVFVWDRLTGDTTLITGGNTYGFTHGDIFDALATISADGRYVAYNTDATNSLPTDRNGGEDVFVWDRTTGTTTRLTNGNGYSFGPVMSADGGYIAYVSDASNLVPGETHKEPGTYLWDRSTGATTRITDGGGPAISADGRYISYTRWVQDGEEVFVWDRTTGTTERITDGNSWAESPSISADGRYVTFHSDSSNLLSRDRNYARDVFVWDRLTRTKRITNGNGDSTEAAISADGKHIAYISQATNLVEGAADFHQNVFVWDRGQAK